MPIVTECYRCELCYRLYETKIDALSCESSHIPGEHLSIVELKYKKDEYDEFGGYPFTIRVVDKKRSGHMAEYALYKEGSVEEFDELNSPIYDDY